MSIVPSGALQQKFNMGYVWAISLVAAMGGLLFGYDWVVISGAKPFYQHREQFNLTSPSDQGWATSCALVGCLAGAVISGVLSDRFGRKRLLILAAFLFAVTSVGTGLAGSFTQFVVWRILGGVAIGLASNLSPMYIAEVAPAAVRGRLVAINQLTIVIGILIAQGTNYAIAEYGASIDREAVRQHALANGNALDQKAVFGLLAGQLPEKDRLGLQLRFDLRTIDQAGPLDLAGVNQVVDEFNAGREKGKITLDPLAVEVEGRHLISWNVGPGWRWMFGVTAIPAVLFFVLMFPVPESPRWLAKNGKPEQARAVLARVGGGDYADRELASIEHTLRGEIEKVNFRDLLEPRMLTILLIGVTLAVYQQWCGINVIFYYASDIFQAAGYNVSGSLLNIVIIGAVNLVFTLVAIGMVDRFGRRGLMLVGSVGLTVVFAALGTCFFRQVPGLPVLLLTLAAIGCYGFSLAPVTWVVLSEIFPNRIRGAAMSVSVFALWTACFVLTYTLPPLTEALGWSVTFWIYTAVCVAGFFFIRKRLPETKGKTLEAIEQELVGSRSPRV